LKLLPSKLLAGNKKIVSQVIIDAGMKKMAVLMPTLGTFCLHDTDDIATLIPKELCL
jgi:hypothetical protein